MTESGNSPDEGPARAAGQPSGPATAAYAPVEPLTPAAEATRKLNSLLWSGGLFYVLGGAVFCVCTWARSSAIRQDTDPGGWSLFIILGALAVSVGTALLLIGLIGWGVKLGREAADV